MSACKDDPSKRLREAAEERIKHQPPESSDGAQAPTTGPRDLLAQQHELHVHQIELQLQNEELQRANRHLDAALQRHTRLFELAPVGYVVLDADGTMRQVNAAACALLNTSRERLLGRRFGLFVAPGSRSHFAILLRQTFESHTQRAADLELTRGEDQQWTAHVACVASDHDSPAPSCLLALVDQTVHRQAQLQSMRLNQALEARVQQRSSERQALSEELERLSEAVTHDLRAPLRHLLTETAPTAEVTEQELKRRLNAAHTLAERMATQLQALTDVSNASSRRLKLTPVNLSRVVADVLAEPDLHPDAHVTVTVDDLPTVITDRAAMHEVFRQLLSNAVKATRGTATPRIRVYVQENTAEHVLCVRDNGMGFNMRARDRLFRAFRKLHAEPDFPGPGVGLVVVQRLLVRLGGRVWADGRVNDGATFWRALPRHPISDR